MALPTLAVLSTGLVTSVGLTAPAACAAMRSGLSNPSETRFIDTSGEWIMAHQVPLEQPWRGRTRLAKMCALAIEECLVDVPREEWRQIPLILCLAEPERPGRCAGPDDELFAEIQRELAAEFADLSSIVAHGRTSIAIALMRARELLADSSCPQVLIAATDSLITAATLRDYERQERLLTSRNSNGFMPGEGAGAALVGAFSGGRRLLCMGIGLANEPAHIDSQQPLRAEGLTLAIRHALTEAGRELHDLDFRIVDLSGEQYYFKEAALALGRVVRQHKEEFDIWHPAENIGEAGATAGLAMMSLGEAACRKGYAPGPRILAHLSADSGARAALVLQFGENDG